MKALVIRDVKKNKGNKEILQGINFSIEKGKITGFIGSNGAGKTTTMKCIMGLCSYEGKIDLMGTKKNKISSLIEEPSFYLNMTGKKNLEITAMYYGIKKDRVDEIVNRLGMSGYINRKVKGYSLGMRQKLGIASVLINDPDIILLDEPMNGLDPEGVMDLRNILKKLAHDEGKAILISSHILAEMQNVCDTAVFIKDGIIVGNNVIEANLEKQYVDMMQGEREYA